MMAERIELSEAEREAMEREKSFAVRSGRGICFDDCWLAARDYYEQRHIEQQARPIEALAEAEARERALRGALAQIDSEVPSEEHWHRMGDSVWVNIGRFAAKIARAALAASPQPDHGPGGASRDVVTQEQVEHMDELLAIVVLTDEEIRICVKALSILDDNGIAAANAEAELCAALERPEGIPDDMVERAWVSMGRSRRHAQRGKAPTHPLPRRG